MEKVKFRDSHNDGFNTFFFAATKPVRDLGHPAIALASVRTVRQHGNTNQGGLVDVYMMDMICLYLMVVTNQLITGGASS